MRTTITLENDVAAKLKALVRSEGGSFKDTVNRVLRRGLSPNRDSSQSEYRLVPHHSPLRPGVDPRKINQINDDLEAQDFVAHASK